MAKEEYFGKHGANREALASLAAALGEAIRSPQNRSVIPGDVARLAKEAQRAIFQAIDAEWRRALDRKALEKMLAGMDEGDDECGLPLSSDGDLTVTRRSLDGGRRVAPPPDWAEALSGAINRHADALLRHADVMVEIETRRERAMAAEAPQGVDDWHEGPVETPVSRRRPVRPAYDQRPTWPEQRDGAPKAVRGLGGNAVGSVSEDRD